MSKDEIAELELTHWGKNAVKESHMGKNSRICPWTKTEVPYYQTGDNEDPYD